MFHRNVSIRWEGEGEKWELSLGGDDVECRSLN